MRKETMITLNDIKEAKRDYQNSVNNTTCKSSILSKELSAQIYLKRRQFTTYWKF